MSMGESKHLIENTKENRELFVSQDKCDKYDYLIAVACGAIGGLIDIFMVGTPGESKACNWTDKQTDKAVMTFAKKMGWNPREKNSDNVASAIGFLRTKYSVNYDQATTKAVDGAFNLWTKDHHMKSLGHSPDIIGLFFSVLNQFTSTSSFISDGQLITIKSETFELQGGNFVSKLFCGIANWFGHIMSDIAGDNGSRAAGKRGMGVTVPFYELFGLCKFGKFSDGKNKQDLAMIATRAYSEGYDARFGLAMAIPVVITNLSIRLIWSIRRHFQYGKPIKECIPTNSHADLRVMLIVGNGTLCVMDGIDAGIKSGGNFLAFFMRLNLIAWTKLVIMVLKEVCIRIGIANPLENQIEAFRRINEALLEYLAQLEKIDVQQYEKEVKDYKHILQNLDFMQTSNEMTAYLLDVYESMELPIPWKGDFNDFMGDKNNTLVFK